MAKLPQSTVREIFRTHLTPPEITPAIRTAAERLVGCRNPVTGKYFALNEAIAAVTASEKRRAPQASKPAQVAAADRLAGTRRPDGKRWTLAQATRAVAMVRRS